MNDGYFGKYFSQNVSELLLFKGKENVVIPNCFMKDTSTCSLTAGNACGRVFGHSSLQVSHSVAIRGWSFAVVEYVSLGLRHKRPEPFLWVLHRAEFVTSRQAF